MRAITVFLIAVALIAGVVSYGGRESYTLTIASTAGGSVIAPGEGTFIYLEGDVVDLVAGIEAGYRLVNWTCDVGTIANVNDAKTTITMNGHCSIIANFEKVNFMVAAGYYHTVGIESDGTVVAMGYRDQYDPYYGQCDVDGWTDITQVAAGYAHTVGLKSDGTVVAVGNNNYGQCDVGDWTDIVQVAAGGYHTVALKSDGSVVAVGDNRKGQ
jgi:alpha-tubulin suppressor-like RCC1 family protein